MSENNTPLDGLDPVQAALKRAVSRRTCFSPGGDRRGGAVDAPLLAACDIGGDDDEEAAGTTTAAASQSNLNFYSTHGESGNVFWAIYRNGIRDGARSTASRSPTCRSSSSRSPGTSTC